MKEAGFKIQDGSKAPLLETIVLKGRVEDNKLAYFTRLTIEHDEAKSRVGDRTLDPANLRFLMADDNALKGSAHLSEASEVARREWTEAQIRRAEARRSVMEEAIASGLAKLLDEERKRIKRQ